MGTNYPVSYMYNVVQYKVLLEGDKSWGEKPAAMPYLTCPCTPIQCCAPQLVNGNWTQPQLNKQFNEVLVALRSCQV